MREINYADCTIPPGPTPAVVSSGADQIDNRRPEPGVENASRDDYQPADGSDYGEPEGQALDPRIGEHFTQQMTAAGVDPGTINAALGWLHSPGRNASLEGQQVEHPYDFRAINGLSPEDRQQLDSFGNALARANAPQEDVVRAVDWFLGLKASVERHQIASAGDAARISREIEAQDLVDRDNTREEMRAQWGTEYAPNIRAINRYLGSLPVRERAKIENEMLPDGSLALNNAGRLQELLEAARNGADLLPGGGMERDEIEQVMRQDRSRYNNDLAMQDRYRQILSEGDGSERPLPSNISGVNAEIAALENLLRTNRREYNAKEGRYRELLRMRDSDN